jgi:Pentapeptide repeats (8 copies)
MAIGIAATLVLAVAVVMVLLRTGGANAISDNAALIGALVALGGVFTAQMVGIALEDRRTQEARALEDRRTQEARDLEARRAGEAALQNYFEDVGELLIEKPLRRASPGDNLSTVVRAQTLSVLEGLDPDRKGILLSFLYESGLIYERKLVVRLVAANLKDATLSGADLGGANLREANLTEAILFRTYLREADLTDAVGLTDEQIAAAKSLDDATMPNGQKYEEWLKSKGHSKDGKNGGP